MTRGPAASPWPSVFALGLACQIAQILYLREFLLVFHGNELSIGLILAAWMLWVGIGSRWSYLLVERVRRPELLLYGNTLAIGLMIPATLPVIRGARHFFDVLPGASLSVPDMVMACGIIMAPVCLLLGFQFVLLARLWREFDGVKDTLPTGKAYMGEAAGNIAGGVLFTFFLVHWTNAFQTAVLAVLAITGALLLHLAFPGPEPLRGRWRKSMLAPALLFCGFAAGLSSLGKIDNWADRLHWSSFAPDHELVATLESRYGKIHVARRDDQYSFFQSGHLVFSAAGAKAESPALEELEAAVLAHFSLAQHPGPQRILLLGGGMRGTLREILRHDVEQVDYVELDERLIAAALPRLAPDSLLSLEDPRVNLRHMDGRLFVKSVDRSYDLVLVDAPDPSTAVLNRFYTAEFFAEVSRRLRPGGVLVIGAMSTPDLRGSAAANRNAALFHTLGSVFPHVLAVGDRNLLFFASHDPDIISGNPAILRERFMARGVPPEVFPSRHFDLLLEEGPLRRVNWVLRHHGRNPSAHLKPPPSPPLFPPSLEEMEAMEAELPPVHAAIFLNSDFRPVGYFLTLVFWNLLAREGSGDAFLWIAMVRPLWILPPVLGAMLAALLFRWGSGGRTRRAASHFAVRLASFTTGLSTMSLQIALLFSFQSIHGFVYEMVGMIVALFMAGLLLGTLATQRKIRDKSNIRTLARVQALIAVFAVAMALALPGAGALTSPAAILTVFSFLTFMAGFMNGLDFPLAAACCVALNRRPEKSTSLIYGIELFGACLGAALASVVVAPVLGILACCYLAAIANATAFGVLLLTRNQKDLP